MDGDGVLVDFTTPALEFINRNGRKKTLDQVVNWHVFDRDRDLEERYKSTVVSDPGFCVNMKPYPGAVEFARAAREDYHLVIVTSPYNVPNWYDGRRDWMVKHLGISPKDVNFMSRKEFFDADVFVDDRVENIVAWADKHTTRVIPGRLPPLPVILDRPWNRVEFQNIHVRRATSWGSLSKLLEAAGFPPVRGFF